MNAIAKTIETNAIARLTMITSRTVAILALLAACVYSTPVLAQVSPIAFVQPEWFTIVDNHAQVVSWGHLSRELTRLKQHGWMLAELF